MNIYRNILSQAWKNTWHNKYLWFFGLFAMLLGNGGEMDIIMRNLNLSLDQGIIGGFKTFAETGIFSFNAIANIGTIMRDDPISFAIALCILLVLGLISLFLIWLSVVSQAALISNSVKINYGKKHDFQDGVVVGMKGFWPILSLNIVSKAIVYLIYIFLSLPILLSISRSASLFMAFIFLVLFIFFIPLAMSVSFICRYAIAYIVVKEEKFIDAVRMGWQLFKKNWLVSIEMAFILFLVNFATGLCLIFFIMVLSIPFMMIAFLFYYWAMVFNFWAIIALAFIAVIALIMLTGAALATFQTSAWTGLYLELLGAGAVSKIARVFGKN